MSRLLRENVRRIRFQLEINILIYRIPRIATYKTAIRIFQYKLLNNILYLIKKLFHFGIISQDHCPFCEVYEGTSQHLLYECTCMELMELILNFLYLIYGTNFGHIFQKKLYYQFNSTECHFWLYRCFRT